MMKFERVFEDGEFEIFRSTNHSDKNRAGEIIHDWDAGTWAAIVIDPVDPVGDGWIENLGEFDSADMAARHLECGSLCSCFIPKRSAERKNRINSTFQLEICCGPEVNGFIHQADVP